MLFSVPSGVSGVSYGGVNYPATSGVITVPDAQATVTLVKAFANVGVVSTATAVVPAGATAQIATVLAAGLLRPDGITLLVAPDGTASVAVGNPDNLVDAATLPAGTNLSSGSLVLRVAGLDNRITLGAAVASQTTSFPALPAGPTPGGDLIFAAYSPTGNVVGRYTAAQLAALFKTLA